MWHDESEKGWKRKVKEILWQYSHPEINWKEDIKKEHFVWFLAGIVAATLVLASFKEYVLPTKEIDELRILTSKLVGYNDECVLWDYKLLCVDKHDFTKFELFYYNTTSDKLPKFSYAECFEQEIGCSKMMLVKVQK